MLFFSNTPTLPTLDFIISLNEIGSIRYTVYPLLLHYGTPGRGLFTAQVSASSEVGASLTTYYFISFIAGSSVHNVNSEFGKLENMMSICT